ncbi:MAG TPA: hypothetical protein DCP63_13815 [Bacteroidetes bacterium]|nr:hypothetical protein [Bacteroidota bacterium]
MTRTGLFFNPGRGILGASLISSGGSRTSTWKLNEASEIPLLIPTRGTGSNSLDALSHRIRAALLREEIHAEIIANTARLALLVILGVLAVLNAGGLSAAANLINSSAIAIAGLYGFFVFLLLKRAKYRPVMKYVTSLIDITSVYVVLFLYTGIEIPSVALKNYVFLAVFPLLALTVFRYDPKLTWMTGAWAVILYVVLFLSVLPHISIGALGYEVELFTPGVTYLGQFTKMFILIAFVVLCGYLAFYTKRLFQTMIGTEVTLQVEKETVERELTIASDVQKRLLPASLPNIKALDLFGSVVQGRFVGGDYFDIIQLTDSSALLVTADVSGKGVPAALIMAQVRAALHLSVNAGASLEQIVDQLNLLLLKSTSARDFVTCFLAEIDASHNTIRYINAGHPPPFLQANNELMRLRKGTVPLGIVRPMPSMAVHTIDLRPGSLFVSYTDGILERMNSEAEQYGEERLAAFVSSHRGLDARSFVTQLMDDVRSFDPARGLDDDVTVLVAKVATLRPSEDRKA